MVKNKILTKVNKLLNEKKLKTLDEKEIDVIVVDVTRVLDKHITELINDYKDKMDIKVNSFEKEVLRRYLIGYPIKLNRKFNGIEKITLKEKELSEAYKLILEGIDKNCKQVLGTIVARAKKHMLMTGNITERYCQYIRDEQLNKHQLIVINQELNDSTNSNNIAEIIEKHYPLLSNYHHLVVVFNSQDSIVDWRVVAEVAVYMENFKVEKRFNLFNKRHKNERIVELNDFLKYKSGFAYDDEVKNIIDFFYEGVSYGFQFKDLFVTDDGRKQVLVMQKFELDEAVKRCPTCFDKKARGNSYLKLLYKSFECNNEFCPGRSKVGRGKRYDALTAKRQTYLSKKDGCNEINKKIYQTMRRDIIKNSSDLLENTIMLYSWGGDSVLIINGGFNKNSYNGRKISCDTYMKYDNKKRINKTRIVKFFSVISKKIIFNKKNVKPTPTYKVGCSTLLNNDSSEVLPYLKSEFGISKVVGAVTSPPYYNAREYSQWQNLLQYFVDMLINAKAVSSALEDNSVYIYNIGDIVGQDNV